MIVVGFAVAGEKMPWHVTHLVTPFILLTGWWVGQLVEGLVRSQKSIEEVSASPAGPALALSIVAVLFMLTVRTSFLANYVNYDYTTEFIDYAHGAPPVKWVSSDLALIGKRTGLEKNIKVAYDKDTSWPMTWYLRGYTNQAYFGENPTREALADAQIVLASDETWKKVENFLGSGYERYEVIRMWWPLEDYKNLNRERISFALSDPAMRSALWDIVWKRDYSQYAGLTNQTLDPPKHWPLADLMRVYIRKDVAEQMRDLNLKIGGNKIEDLAPQVDHYANVRVENAPERVISPGLSAPRGIAVGPDGSVYVADTGSSRVVKLDPNGNLVAVFGERTPAGGVSPPASTFNEPWGIAVDSQGYVYVADTWNHRIQKFDSSGNFILAWGTPGLSNEGIDRFWGPRGVAVSPDGRVYVTDTGNKRVAVFDSNGLPLFDFNMTNGIPLDEPVGIAVGPDGSVYAADTWNLQIAIFTPDGHFLQSLPIYGWAGSSLDNKPYIAVDSHGLIYLTDPEGFRVIVLSSNGEPVRSFGQYGPEQNNFGMPAGIAVAPDGSLWVSDAGNNRLARFAPVQ